MAQLGSAVLDDISLDVVFTFNLTILLRIQVMSPLFPISLTQPNLFFSS